MKLTDQFKSGIKTRVGYVEAESKKDFITR
jgi:hypothetical protein